MSVKIDYKAVARGARIATGGGGRYGALPPLAPRASTARGAGRHGGLPTGTAGTAVSAADDEVSAELLAAVRKLETVVEEDEHKGADVLADVAAGPPPTPHKAAGLKRRREQHGRTVYDALAEAMGASFEVFTANMPACTFTQRAMGSVEVMMAFRPLAAFRGRGKDGAVCSVTIRPVDGGMVTLRTPMTLAAQKEAMDNVARAADLLADSVADWWRATPLLDADDFHFKTATMLTDGFAVSAEGSAPRVLGM